MTSPSTQRCSHHPQRQAFALCMSCRQPLCQECATQWDGIWYCAACLGAKRDTVRHHSHAGGWIAVALALIVTLFLGAKFMVWTGALLAGLR